MADPGLKLLSADYSQIELRLAAHMADVPQLKEAFRAGEDIHAITAEELFGRVDRDTRNQAKTINFAILYGSSAWGIAGRLGLPKDEGKAIIDRYFERFPGIRAFIHSTLAFAREHGFTRTLFGRKTHFEPNIRSPNPSIRGGAERAAINAPIQGTSADLIKRAMARMDGALARCRARRREDAAPGPRRAGVRSARRARGRGRGGHQEGDGRAPPSRRSSSTCRSTSRSAGARTGARRIDRRRARRPPADAGAPDADMATLARGGRLNVFGFVLRLAATPAVPVHRGPDLRRGRARALRLCGAGGRVRGAARGARAKARTRATARQCEEAAGCIVADALLVAAIGSAIGMAILFVFPKAMYPTTPVNGLDRLLAITVIAIAWTDIALAALAYHDDVASTVRARSIVEPWTISIVAFAWSYISSMTG